MNKSNWRPAAATARLGQIGDVITGSVARSIVERAEPVARRIVSEERTKFSQSLISGIPWVIGAALAYIGTSYFVPAKPTPKAIGYAASALMLGAGAWQTFSGMSEPVVESEATPEIAPPPLPGTTGLVDQAAEAIVAEADPKIRQIIQEERVRAVDAAKAGLPLAVASLATFLTTLFVVSDDSKFLKAAGYAGSALLLGAGSWIALDKEASI